MYNLYLLKSAWHASEKERCSDTLDVYLEFSGATKRIKQELFAVEFPHHPAFAEQCGILGSFPDLLEDRGAAAPTIEVNTATENHIRSLV